MKQASRLPASLKVLVLQWLQCLLISACHYLFWNYIITVYYTDKVDTQLAKGILIQRHPPHLKAKIQSSLVARTHAANNTSAKSRFYFHK